MLDNLKEMRLGNRPWKEICKAVQDMFTANKGIAEEDILKIFPDKKMADFNIKPDKETKKKPSAKEDIASFLDETNRTF